MITDDELASAVKEADCKANVFDILGMSKSGSAYKLLSKKIEELDLDTSHWYSKRHSTKARSLDEYLKVDGPAISSFKLKSKLFNAGLLESKCSNEKCGITEWFGKTSILQLDHINGNPRDNRIENLRILCANCHTLTETWGYKIR